MRDPPPPSEKSALLPALLLVAGNSSSRVATWLDVKFPTNMASYAPLDADDTRAAGGTMPILCMRSTSPRLKVGMCASGCVAIRLLLMGRGLLVAAFCRGGVAIKGYPLLSCTSSVNRARR